MSAQILVVEDEGLVALSLQRKLENLGYVVPCLVDSGEKAIEKTAELRPDLVLMDVNLSGSMDGIETTNQIRRQFDVPVIYLTAYSDSNTIERARLSQPYGYLVKPFDERELLATVETSLYRHKIEKALRQSEEQFRQVFEMAPIGMVLCDANGRFTNVNRSYCQMIGYTPQELVGHHLTEFTHPDDITHNLDLLEKLKQNLLPAFQIEKRYLHKNGQYIYVNLHAALLRDEQGQPRHFVAQIVNITELRQAEMALHHSEENFRALVDTVPTPIGITSLQDKLLYINPAALNLLGYSKEELDELGLVQLVHPDHREVIKQWVMHNLVDNQATPPLEIKIITKEGEERWLYFTAHPIQFGGQPALLGSAFDLTRRKKVEEALSLAERRYQTLLDQVPVATYIVEITADTTRTMEVYISPHLEEFLQVKLSEWAGHNYDLWVSMLHPEDRQRAIAEYQTFLEKRTVYNTEYRMVTSQGVLYWVHDQAAMIPGHEEGIYLVYGTMSDITARKQLEKRLDALHRLGEELLHLENRDAIMQRVLETAVYELGFEFAEYGLVDETHQELIYYYLKEDHPTPVPNMRLSLTSTPPIGVGVAVVQSGQSINLPDVSKDPRYISDPANWGQSELCVPIKTGEQVIGVLNAESQQPGYFTVADQQLFESLAAQVAAALENLRLLEAERQAHQTTETLRAAGLALSQTLNLETVLATLLDYLGQLIPYDSAVIMLKTPEDELVVRAHRDRLPVPEMLRPNRIQMPALVKNLLSHQESTLIHDTSQYPNWEYRSTSQHVRNWLAVPLIASGNCFGLYSLTKNIPHFFTAEHQHLAETLATQAALAIQNALLYEDLQKHVKTIQQTQTHLVFNEKMAALGRLTASVAHEMNNPIQAVLGCLTLAMERLEEGNKLDDVNRYLSIVKNEITRVALIVHHMRDFYRPALDKMSLTDLTETLNSILNLVAKQLKENRVIVEYSYCEGIPLIQANENQLKQVFLNLILNAIDSMPQGGLLRININLGQMQLRGLPHMVPAICLTFYNNGKAIAPELLSRIFEPFFTTKEQGSGLGLSISYGIIQAHYGEITVQSSPDMGTTFTILLPLQPTI